MSQVASSAEEKQVVGKDSVLEIPLAHKRPPLNAEEFCDNPD
jgi:hypothetical protein